MGSLAGVLRCPAMKPTRVIEFEAVHRRYGATYSLTRSSSGEPIAIQCLVCERTSYHPDDVKHRFCACCGVFHDDMTYWLDTRLVC